MFSMFNVFKCFTSTSDSDFSSTIMAAFSAARNGNKHQRLESLEPKKIQKSRIQKTCFQFLNCNPASTLKLKTRAPSNCQKKERRLKTENAVVKNRHQFRPGRRNGKFWTKACRRIFRKDFRCVDSCHCFTIPRIKGGRQ